MNTHVNVSVNASAANALQCAYDTLLSFEIVDDAYMKKSILTVYGNVQYSHFPYDIFMAKKASSGKHDLSVRIPCLINIKPFTNTLCEVSLAANTVGAKGLNDSSAGRSNEFIAEFLKRFAETLENTDI